MYLFFHLPIIVVLHYCRKLCWYIYIYDCLWFIYILHSIVSSLQQTVPPGDVAVCPLSTVQYTCVADTRMLWRELGSSATSNYSAVPSTASQVDDTGIAGVFKTVLTNINGTILTSTATIYSVNLTDDGINISCVGPDVANFKLVQVEGHFYACMHAVCAIL